MFLHPKSKLPNTRQKRTRHHFTVTDRDFNTFSVIKLLKKSVHLWMINSTNRQLKLINIYRKLLHIRS